MPGSLLAALADFGDARDVMVHPTRHRGATYPDNLSTLTMRTTSKQHVNSQILTLRKSGLVWIGHQRLHVADTARALADSYAGASPI